jgi:aminotransferase
VRPLNLPDAYYDLLVTEYLERRDLMVQILEEAGLKVSKPLGAYYVLADISPWGERDVDAADHLVRNVGVAAVPGSSFYARSELGAAKLRFSFSKRIETLNAAGDRLARA